MFMLDTTGKVEEIPVLATVHSTECTCTVLAFVYLYTKMAHASNITTHVSRTVPRLLNLYHTCLAGFKGRRLTKKTAQTHSVRSLSTKKKTILHTQHNIKNTAAVYIIIVSEFTSSFSSKKINSILFLIE